ncbi:monoglyceride lipase-like [Limulus polyphemus]|uniref:Monoglyceride lipase-like n=1 Tax=Limulus polyphemus TaxID=6850 RepID=A0ABM1TQX5_LIMPO|nr:monoglyceride lipase-like [Limulus polyphemus]
MRPKEFTGIVLIAAAISMNTEGITPLKCFLANLLGRLLPHFPISSIDQDLVVRSEEAKQIIANDPYHYNGFVKAGWAKTMLETLRELPSCVKNVDFPVLILHGGSDKVCDVSGAKMLFDSAKSKDKSLKVYPHSYHSLLREPDGISDQVITDVIDWMELRIG